ncbi:microtubule-associated protein 9 isoform X2 [Ranitomeya variabilis]|uniref:microtubule-associated protein 9 isoform X2 n=1 Tax=Ranitomeya variabilis TaxID=490064 RepID=UPI004057401B
MDDDDENLSTFLAYTKSPKTTKRTSFQDELKKAVSARVSRQQAVEEAEYSDYSEEFESDDSLEESLGRTSTIQSKLKKGRQDFQFSDSEEDSYGKTTFLKKSKETERSFSKYSSRSKSIENINQGDEDDGGSKPGPLEKIKTPKGADDKDRKPIPKPRAFRTKSSPSPQGLGISLSDEGFPPAPLHRNLSERSGHLEDKSEGKRARDGPASLSAPSSLMRLNDSISASKTQTFSERCSPEGLWPSGPPTPASRVKPLPIAAEKHNKTRSKGDSEEIIKDVLVREEDFSENKESSGNGRKSPSAFDLMISDVKEKFQQQDTKDDSIVKSHEIRDDHEKIKQTNKQLDHLKNLKATMELGRSHSNRKSSKLGSRVSAKSRYLGTLTILDTSVNKESGEVEAADKLRATVYQNWLGKKKIFLQELQKIKKAEEELEKEKAKQDSTMKKEEAIAAFRAWKAEKKKEIKHSQKKKNMEEKKMMEEIQEIASRKEDCRKAFEKWKEAKEDYIKERVKKEKHTEIEKKKQEQKTVMEKKQENMSAFERWNDRKEHVLKEKKKQEIHEKQKLKTLQAEREKKEKIAMEKYEEWLERKESQEQKHKKVQVKDDPPWSPPGRTIPSGR